MDEVGPSPQLGDAPYRATVLRLPADRSEDQLDLELLAKAHGLGIRASLPSVSHHRPRAASVALSDSSASTSQDQLFSAASDASASTYLTPHSSIIGPPSLDVPDSSRQSKSWSFSSYERFLAQHATARESSKSARPPAPADSSAQSIFSVSTKKGGFSGIKNRMMLRRKTTRCFEPSLSCWSCRNTFDLPSSLRTLSCGHVHCLDCLRLKIKDASADESKMPPRCCEPVPASVIQAILEPASQEVFLRAVVQFSTPRESRIVCPSASCGVFIPRRRHVDPKAPFTATCHRCHTRVCTLCKRDAHPTGKDCPQDAQVQATSRAGFGPGRKRCYKCRRLVERPDGPTHLICTCGAQFCSMCGGVWDTTVGCPNICTNDDDFARQRDSDDCAFSLPDALDAAVEAERDAAEKRSARHSDVQSLQLCQRQEMNRFCDFEEETRNSVRERQARRKAALAEKHSAEEAKVKGQHAQMASQLEDSQIAEEMELRASLEQSERTIRARIKHMEAYCEGLGRNPGGSAMPPRVVTEENLRALGHQYNIRDDIERQHQSKISMMRDRQAKRMEDLLERQLEESAQVAARQQVDKTGLEEALASEDEAVNRIFASRTARLRARWHLAIEVLCKELQDKDGAKYASVPPPTWPEAGKLAASMD
ncbi:hypothetical protein XA68_11980 [Ophiocordyceps unilateralis]|uniref:RBR-type E3 ubiquitin transferase n=1 Tax=Ophiocordyceps unilateralis TaxID=268505 RepID=A0A2A9PPE6_OPHUN|nr:hypothetical protein XA68_11980 [Ophiocordyceps unilateralis]